MIGKTISHYRVTRQLGAGGMGVVYEAVDTKLNRPVALKFLPPELTSHAEAKARFVHEAQAASALDHPNVCTVYEIDETPDGQMFLAMACYEGETLKERIARGPLALDEAMDVTRQVADGLAKAHEREIVHRDIKPANLFVTSDGLVKILDFGLAKLEGQTKITRTGTTLGTASYMSPEQARGEETDRRSDLWCLGVVLYEMVTGRVPFQGENAQAVINGIMTADPDPVTGLRTGIPLELERIIGKCLAKDPDLRYQSAGDVIVDLRRIGSSSEEETVTISRADWKRRRRNRGPFLAAAVAFAALIAVVFVPRLREIGFVGTDDGAITSLAVLPLQNLMNDPDQAYFVAGMHESLILQLAGISSLRVISRTSAMRYRDSDLSVPEIADELGVDAVIEGSVMRDGNHVRVTVQLISGRDDGHLWADSYDRELGAALALHSELARAIAGRIEATIEPEEEERLASAGQAAPEVVDEYLQGMHFLGKYNHESIREAELRFRECIDLDPLFAPAHAGLGLLYCIQGYVFDFASRTDRYETARAHIQRALELDGSLANAHFGLAQLSFEYDWDHVTAEQEYWRAIELNRSDHVLLVEFSDFLASRERWDESFEQAMRALEVAPGSAVVYGQLGSSRFWSRRYDDAIPYLERAIELDPQAARPIVKLGWVRMEQEDYQGALELFMRAAEISDWVAFKPHMGAAHLALGDTSQARRLLDETVVGKRSNTEAIGLAYALGDKALAFQILEDLLAQRARGMNWLTVMAEFDAMRDDPRFIELRARRDNMSRLSPEH